MAAACEVMHLAYRSDHDNDPNKPGTVLSTASAIIYF